MSRPDRLPERPVDRQPLSVRLRSPRSFVLNPLSSPPPSAATKSCTLAPTEGQEQHEKPIGHVRVSLSRSAWSTGGERCEGGRVRRGTADTDLPGIRVADHRRRQPERDRGGELPAVRSEHLARRHAAAADGRRANLPRALHRPKPVRRKHPRPRAGPRVRGAVDDEGFRTA